MTVRRLSTCNQPPAGDHATETRHWPPSRCSAGAVGWVKSLSFDATHVTVRSQQPRHAAAELLIWTFGNFADRSISMLRLHHTCERQPQSRLTRLRLHAQRQMTNSSSTSVCVRRARKHFAPKLLRDTANGQARKRWIAWHKPQTGSGSARTAKKGEAFVMTVRRLSTCNHLPVTTAQKPRHSRRVNCSPQDQYR